MPRRKIIQIQPSPWGSNKKVILDCGHEYLVPDVLGPEEGGTWPCAACPMREKE